MQESMPQTGLESEIAELSKQIELKRAQLETERGIVEEREVVKEAVNENYVAPIAMTAATDDTASSDDSTIEPQDSEIQTKVAEAISIFEEEGIEKAVKTVQNEHPLVVDRFHDTLVDELYEKLREKGIVS